MAQTGKKYYLAFILMAISLYGAIFVEMTYDIEFEILLPLTLPSVLWLFYVALDIGNPNSKKRTIKIGNFDLYMSPKLYFNYLLIVCAIILIMYVFQILVPAIKSI